jgi:hypothetical protein
VKLASQADLVACGDIDGDRIEDLIGIWPTQGGVWVKHSETGAWARLSSTACHIAAGKMRAEGASPQATGTEAATMATEQAVIELPLPMGGNEFGPAGARRGHDLSSRGPGGAKFVYTEDNGQVPMETRDEEIARILSPGPGEPGFSWVEQENSFPQESAKTDRQYKNGQGTRSQKPKKK